MENSSTIQIITAIVTALNTLGFLLFAYKKLRPELKKLELDVDAGIVDAANLNLEGAKISAQMLLDRINELKIELDSERKSRKEELSIEIENNRIERDRIETARRDDAEYFRRRIKDMEREASDLRNWAAKLVKQLVEAGQIPVPFLPSTHESDTKHTKPRPDLEAR